MMQMRAALPINESQVAHAIKTAIVIIGSSPKDEMKGMQMSIEYASMLDL